VCCHGESGMLLWQDFLQTGCTSCHRTNSVRALKADYIETYGSKVIENSVTVLLSCLFQHHRTGLAAKIWLHESKDDIEKWISERKRCVLHLNKEYAVTHVKWQILINIIKGKGNHLD